MNMQSLILTKITEEIAKDPTILLVVDEHYANTGTLRTFEADTMARLATVTYDFQATYCSFGPLSARVASLWYDKPREAGNAEWVCGSIPKLVRTVVAALRGE